MGTRWSDCWDHICPQRRVDNTPFEERRKRYMEPCYPDGRCYTGGKCYHSLKEIPIR